MIFSENFLSVEKTFFVKLKASRVQTQDFVLNVLSMSATTDILANKLLYRVGKLDILL
jgi:hypothetical protein